MTGRYSLGWATLWLCACTVQPQCHTIDAALRLGRDQAQPCRQQVAEDALELLDCVRVRSQRDWGASPAGMDDARRLGVLFSGWFMADLDAASAIEGAADGASTLLRQWLRLQQQLQIGDEQLCVLIDAPCGQVMARKREAAAGLSPESG